MIVGCYVLDLYCDNKLGHYPHAEYVVKEFPDTYTGQTRGFCVRRARKNGWVFHGDRRVTCPKCNKKGSAR